MFKPVLLVCVLGLLCGTVARAQESSGQGAAKAQKILIAYFSKTNNTRAVAEQIQAGVGGDLFHVRTKKPYPEDYRETTRIARSELDNNERPEPEATIAAEDMRQYDIVFIGYPSWWGTIPMVMFTFLEQHDLSGKTIVPFCTHEGSGLGRGPGDIQKLCPDSTVLRGLAIRGTAAGRSQSDVTNWLRQLGLVE